MVEALVAIPFFIIIFASTMFIGEFYGSKLKTLRQSRESAWVTASAGCEGNGGEKIDDAQGAPLDEAENAPGTEIFAKGFGDSSVTMSASVVASGLIGGYTSKITSTTVIACNEPHRDTTIGKVLDYIWKIFETSISSVL